MLTRAAANDQTQALIAADQQDGTSWCGPTVWHHRPAMRISVSGSAPTAEDVTVRHNAVDRYSGRRRSRDLFALQAKLSASSIAWTKSSGASCGRLWPMPPVSVRCAYLPVNRAA